MADPIDDARPAPRSATVERAVEGSVERAVASLEGLSLKGRLQLIDALKAGAFLDTPEGVRLTLHSEYELRRAKKRKDGDRPIRDWVRSFAPGEVFYDIGANTGGFALLAGRHHEGRVPVYAFEPSYSSYEALVRNVIANGLTDCVYPLPLAFYAETALRPFHYRRVEAGAAKHGVDIPFDTKQRELFEPVFTQQVLTMTLDDFIARFGAPPPVHVKIDIDGHEDKVLTGAGQALAASIRTLCVEVVQADPSDPRPQNLERRLADMGFAAVQVIDHHGDRYPRGFDYLFARR